MSGLATTYCVALFAATFSAISALMLIRTLNHFDDTHS